MSKQTSHSALDPSFSSSTTPNKTSKRYHTDKNRAFLPIPKAKSKKQKPPKQQDGRQEGVLRAANRGPEAQEGLTITISLFPPLPLLSSLLFSSFLFNVLKEKEKRSRRRSCGLPSRETTRSERTAALDTRRRPRRSSTSESLPPQSPSLTFLEEKKKGKKKRRMPSVFHHHCALISSMPHQQKQSKHTTSIEKKKKTLLWFQPSKKVLPLLVPFAFFFFFLFQFCVH